MQNNNNNTGEIKLTIKNPENSEQAKRIKAHATHLETLLNTILNGSAYTLDEQESMLRMLSRVVEIDTWNKYNSMNLAPIKIEEDNAEKKPQEDRLLKYRM